MKFQIIRKISLLVLVLAIGVGFVACKKDTPTEAYKGLYAAVKSKDTEAIKKWMSKSTLGFAESVSKQQNKPIEQVFENGFTGTTFASSLPEIRDERVKDNMGAIEVWNSKIQKWEDLPFIKEEDGWKLAVGDLFAGTYVRPGIGQSQKDAEEANKMSNNIIQVPGGINGNLNTMPKVNGKNPVPMPPASNKPSQKQDLDQMKKGNMNSPAK
jgi:hypothetical protein